MSAHLPRRFDYVLRTRDGEKIVLNSTHRARYHSVEDRSSSCMALVGELNKRVATANPHVQFFHELRWSYKLDIAAHRALDWIGLLLWKLLRRTDLDRTANFLGWAMRRIGPRRRGQRTARANLTAAYRDKSAAEIEQILSGMWANLGRLAADMGRLISAGPDSVWKIRKALKEGLHVGMLVDQHFAQGVEVMFFGRPCMVNPMPARFAQLFDCPVHGFRTIRLPGNRIQIELTDEVDMPRDAGGKIDVASAMQKITSIIEGWIRERPEQWLWLQRRWR